MIALAVLGHDVDAETARAELRTVSLAEPLVTVQWWAPALFGVAGALAVAGAALLARTGPAPRSFERSAGTDPTAWEQLDAGDDPTTAGADDGGASDAEETQWAQAEGEDGR